MVLRIALVDHDADRFAPLPLVFKEIEQLVRLVFHSSEGPSYFGSSSFSAHRGVALFIFFRKQNSGCCEICAARDGAV